MGEDGVGGGTCADLVPPTNTCKFKQTWLLIDKSPQNRATESESPAPQNRNSLAKNNPSRFVGLNVSAPPLSSDAVTL